jgi:hypothetical protein
LSMPLQWRSRMSSITCLRELLFDSDGGSGIPRSTVAIALRRHVDWQAVLRAHLPGEFVARARAPYMRAVCRHPGQKRNGADESARFIACDAAISARRQVKFAVQGWFSILQQQEHTGNVLPCQPGSGTIGPFRFWFGQLAPAVLISPTSARIRQSRLSLDS